MDFLPEEHFVFSVIEYVFSVNKCHVPSSLLNKMYESGGPSNRFLSTIVRRAIEIIIQAQKEIFQRVCRETVESYYKEKLIEHFTERELLEFLGFHARNCFLDCIDLDTSKLRNPSDAIKTYNLVMNVIKDSKKLNCFTMSGAKLNAAAKEIVNKGLNKYRNQLEKLCKIMVSAATEKAKISQSSRTIYVVTETGKFESKLLCPERVGDNGNNNQEKKNEESPTMTKIVDNKIKGKEKREIRVSQEFNDSESTHNPEVVESGSEKDSIKMLEETDRIRKEVMEAMQEAPKTYREETLEELKIGDVKEEIFIPDSDVLQELIFDPDFEILEISAKPKKN